MLYCCSHPIGSAFGKRHDGHHRVGSQSRRTGTGVSDPYARHVIEFAVRVGDADGGVFAHAAGAELMGTDHGLGSIQDG